VLGKASTSPRPASRAFLFVMLRIRAAGDYALARRGREPDADQLDHQGEGEAVRQHECVGAGGEQLERAAGSRDWSGEIEVLIVARS
jgi:hypothetical protein